MNMENLKQIISEKAIKQRVEEIAKEISATFEGEVPILVSVLNGSFIFASDLLRALKVDCEIDFIKVYTFSGNKAIGTIDFQIDIFLNIFPRLFNNIFW